MRKLLLIFLLMGWMVFPLPVSGADSAQEVFNQANTYYSAEKFLEAEELYRSLADTGFRSGALFYNLGNANYKLEKLGPAIWWYERARRLTPGDSDLIANLEFLNTQTVDQAIEREPNMFIKPILLGEKFININQLSLAAAIVYQLIIWFLIIAPFAASLRRYQTRFIISLLVVFIFIIAPLAHQVYIESHPSAIIIAKQAPGKSGPDKDFPTQFSLHEGTRVRVEQFYHDYYEVSLMVPDNGDITRPKILKGWIRKDKLGLI